MNAAHIADLVSVAAIGTAVYFMIRGCRFLPARGVRIMFAGFLGTILFRDLVNLSHLLWPEKNVLDVYSQILQLTTPILWSYFIYSFLLWTEGSLLLSAERKRRVSKLFYFRIFRKFPEAVFVLDETGRILYSNRVASNWLGRSRDDLLGIEIADVTERGTGGGEPVHDGKPLERSRSFDTVYTAADGSRIPAHVIEMPVRFEWLDALLRVCSRIDEKTPARAADEETER